LEQRQCDQVFRVIRGVCAWLAGVGLAHPNELKRGSRVAKLTVEQTTSGVKTNWPASNFKYNPDEILALRAPLALG
jgi:hypothetical protein